MANRYWVGGSGTWNTTSTTNWSASSGGASGASVPTLADSVFFDQVGTYTVSSTTTNNCLDFTVSAGTVTFSGSSTVAIYGSMSLIAGTLWSFTGNVNFRATTTGKTVTTNGVNFAGLNTFLFSGVGGGWTLGSALSGSGRPLIINAGTLNTAGYACTFSSLGSGGSSVKTINLSSSTITVSSIITAIDFNNVTNLTFNAGTSTIVITSTSQTQILAVGFTFYNVNVNGIGINIPANSGSNTFNNLTFNSYSALRTFTTSYNQTISGTLTVNSSSAFNRLQVLSGTSDSSITLTCAAVSLQDVDFKDITAAGASGTWTGTRLGNGKNNSNITFSTAKTVYYGQTGSANWGALSWSATSGGALDDTQFPLAQDTAVFPAATYPASGSTTTINALYFIGTIDMSLRTTNTMTLATGNRSYFIYGNWINGTGITNTGSGTLQFVAKANQEITGAGSAFPQNFSFNNAGFTTKLMNAVTLDTRSAFLVNGTLDLNGNTFTVTAGFTVSAGTKNLTFNGGTLVCPGTTTQTFTNSNPTGFTTTAGTGIGAISLTAASAKTFAGGGSTFNCTLNQGGAGALTITGANTFSNITNTYKSTGATSILFTAGTTSTFTNWNANGEATRLLTIGSVTAASHTLSKASGTVSAEYLSISRSTATGGATWNATNSTDGGNNSGWVFVGTATATGNFLVFF